MRRFPNDFLWGTATSSHQVEGGNPPNQWTWWEQQPGRIYQGHKAGKACDWWHHAERDFDLMVKFHHNAHRLSLEWSRIQPEEGRFDQQALTRYREMLQGLRARGIEPVVTLHHFTEPMWFWTRGSWFHPRALQDFQEYVAYVADHLGEHIRYWCTINEPVIYAYLGYMEGRFPPGERNPRRTFQVLKRLIQAHGVAYHTLHQRLDDIQVGLAKSLFYFAPAREDPLDRLAARGVWFLFNTLTLDAVTRGRMWPPLGTGWTPDLNLYDTVDFIGINYYSRRMVRFDIKRPHDMFIHEYMNPEGELSDTTAAGTPYSEIYPEGLYELLRWAWKRYRKPLMITENGLPDADDDQRPSFIIRHLEQVHRAIEEGVDVRGYFHWTLVDNFEWADGWKLRFGLVALDPESQERTIRPSAWTYAEICQNNGLP